MGSQAGAATGASPPAEPPGHLDHAADRQGDTQADQQPGPGPSLEGLAAEPADKERVARPQDTGEAGTQDETAPRVADEPAGERDRGPAARNEPAADDDPDAVLLQGALGPCAAVRAPLAREDPPADSRPEPAAEQVSGVVAEERAGSGQHDQHRDTRVGASRGRDAQGDHRGLAGQERDQRVERGDEDCDQVGSRGADVQLGQVDHQRPPRRRELRTRASTTARAAANTIHGAITIRSLPVIPPVQPAAVPGR